MRKILLAGAFFLSIITFSQTSKEIKIREFIKVTGVDVVGLQAFNKMIDMYKETRKDIPSEFWDEFRKEVSAEDLVKLYAPIYSKYYSEADLDALLKFYESPVGKKMISTMPDLMKDSMEAGKEWGQKIGQKVVDKIIKEYGDDGPPPPMNSKNK